MLLVHSAMSAMTGAGFGADPYMGADIVLDFVGVKNGGVPLYRVAGTLYPSPAAAGFAGAGVIDATGYKPGAAICLNKIISFGANAHIHVRFGGPAAAPKRIVNLSASGSGVDRISSTNFPGPEIQYASLQISNLSPPNYTADRATFGLTGSRAFLHMLPNKLEIAATTYFKTTDITLGVGGGHSFPAENWTGSIKMLTVNFNPLTPTEIEALSL